MIILFIYLHLFLSSQIFTYKITLLNSLSKHSSASEPVVMSQRALTRPTATLVGPPALSRRPAVHCICVEGFRSVFAGGCKHWATDAVLGELLSFFLVFFPAKAKMQIRDAEKKKKKNPVPHFSRLEPSGGAPLRRG